MNGSMEKLGPKRADHPTVGELCPACNKPFKKGDYTTLVFLGPGDNLEARKRRDEGRPYTGVAIEVHWECAHRGGVGVEGDK